MFSRDQPEDVPISRDADKYDNFVVPVDSEKMTKNDVFMNKDEFEDLDSDLVKSFDPSADMLPKYLKQEYPILNADQHFIVPRRIVHLDLKGAHPKIDYYQSFFALISKLGATGVLIEYEDVFPFKHKLASLRSTQAYTEEDIEKIIQLAAENHLELIPLIQTFGHLEWMLKHENYSAYREVYEYPQVVCLSNFDAIDSLKMAIDQVMHFHNKTSNFFHIGADEAYYVGKCAKCKKAIDALGGDRDQFMLRHIANISSYVYAKYGKKVLMWHDMLVNVSSQTMKEFKFGEFVEPVVWAYDQNLQKSGEIWNHLAKVFPNVWGASAFKGANGSHMISSNIPKYLNNHQSWLTQMNENYMKFTQFRGLILTGWQRFNHFSVLCELLPVGMPSLVINLLTLIHGYFDETILKYASFAMNCPDDEIFLFNSSNNGNVTQGCKFPGSKLYELIQLFSSNQHKMHQEISNDHIVQGWLSPYNIRHDFSSVFFMEKISTKIEQHLSVLTEITNQLKFELGKIFYPATVDEFLLENVQADRDMLEKMLKDAKRLASKRNFLVKEF